MSIPGPDPIVTPAAMTRPVLDRIITSVQADGVQAAPAIKSRIAASREGGNVCMMGGWTS